MIRLGLTAAWLATSHALLAPPRQILALRPALPRPARAAARLGAADAAAVSDKPSLFARLNNFGLSLKDRSRRQREALQGANLLMKLPRGVYVAALSLAFVGYRAYRGFFVVLPAVFSAVRARVREGWVEVEEAATADVDPATGELKKRSAILINIGAALVVAAYMVEGVCTLLVRGAAECVRGIGALWRNRPVRPSDDNVPAAPA